MKNFLALLLVSCGISVALISCDHDQVAPPDSESGSARIGLVSKKDVSVVDGYLRFADPKAFQKVLTSLNKSKDFDGWEKQFAGYKSMRITYRDLNTYDIGKALEDGSISRYKGAYSVTEEQDGQKSYDRAVVDQALATVVNGHGVTQIGDSLYRVDEQWVIALPLASKAEINDDKPAHGVFRAVVHKLSQGKSKNGRLASDHDQNYIEYHADGLKLRRFRTLGWSTNYWFPSNYWSAGYRVWHQRNNWWGWGSEPADYLSVTVKVTIDGQLRYYPGGFVPSQGSDSGNGRDEVQYRYSEDWTSASVGRARVEYTWSGKGNGSNGGQPINRGYSSSWEEDI